MSLAVEKARPPFVAFERRQIEDRDASIASGHYATRDVDFAIVTPHGSKDRFERVVEDWFGHLAREAAEGRFDPEWIAGYKTRYKAWQDGQELPVNGYALRQWPVITAGHLRRCIDLNILTVEDLAVSNEQTIMHIGMGARELVQRAKLWLEESAGPGKAVARAEAAEARLAAMATRMESLEAQLRQLGAGAGAGVIGLPGGAAEVSADDILPEVRSNPAPTHVQAPKPGAVVGKRA